MNDKVKILCRNAIVAGIYVIFSYVFSFISFGPIQFRIAEALVLLCFFRRDYTIGVTLGCLLSNIYSAVALSLPLDLLIGTATTFVGCLFVSFCKHLFLSSLIPVVLNGAFVGLELTFLIENTNTFWFNCAFVALGEFVCVSILGYLILLTVGKKEKFHSLIMANRNKDFVW